MSRNIPSIVSMQALSHNRGKQIGVEQAEHRITNVIRAIEADRRDAVAGGSSWAVRKCDLQRAGAAQALGAIRELLRNYQGRE